MKKIIIVILVLVAIWFAPIKQLTEKTNDLKNYENSILKDALKAKNKRIMELEEELAQYNILYAELQINYEDKVIESEIRKIGERVVYRKYDKIHKTGTVKNWLGQQTKWEFYGLYETVALLDNSKMELIDGILYMPPLEICYPSLTNREDAFTVKDKGLIEKLFTRRVYWEEKTLIEIDAESEIKADIDDINEIVRQDLIKLYPEYKITEIPNN
jgi:hypothetical protein